MQSCCNIYLLFFFLIEKVPWTANNEQLYNLLKNGDELIINSLNFIWKSIIKT